MNNEDNLVIHTFNTDIEEELKKKDANILDITNANNNHIEPSEPPNYRILFIALILSVSMALIYYAINFYIDNNLINTNISKQNTDISATSTILTTEKDNLQTLMSNSYSALYPYIDLYLKDKSYLIYKIKNYDGLINVLISNENNIKTDMQKYFDTYGELEQFKDVAYNNWDMRIASSIATSSTIIYAIANKEYVIFTNDLKNWENAYNIINTK